MADHNAAHIRELADLTGHLEQTGNHDAQHAGKPVRFAKELDSTITVTKVGGSSTKATKLMALMGLCVKVGDKVIVTVEGGSEIANLEAMKKFCKENL